VLHHGFWVVFCYLVIDANKVTTDYLRTHGLFVPERFFEQPWFSQVALSFFNMLAGYAGLMLPHSFIACLAVLSGFASPVDFPDLTGPIVACSSLGTFWRDTWHSLLQPSLLKISRPVSRGLLRLAPGSTPDRVVQLFVAFISSGVLHACASFSASRHGAAFQRRPDVWQTDLLFFSIQPFGILLERVVKAMAQRAGMRGSWATRLLGKIWVLAWFSLTLPIFVGNQVIAGLWDGRSVDGPVSALLKRF
jgi:hypothetical protein